MNETETAESVTEDFARQHFEQHGPAVLRVEFVRKGQMPSDPRHLQDMRIRRESDIRRAVKFVRSRPGFAGRLLLFYLVRDGPSQRHIVDVPPPLYSVFCDWCGVVSASDDLYPWPLVPGDRICRSCARSRGYAASRETWDGIAALIAFIKRMAPSWHEGHASAVSEVETLPRQLAIIYDLSELRKHAFFLDEHGFAFTWNAGGQPVCISIFGSHDLGEGPWFPATLIPGTCVVGTIISKRSVFPEQVRRTCDLDVCERLGLVKIANRTWVAE